LQQNIQVDGRAAPKIRCLRVQKDLRRFSLLTAPKMTRTPIRHSVGGTKIHRRTPEKHIERLRRIGLKRAASETRRHLECLACAGSAGFRVAIDKYRGIHCASRRACNAVDFKPGLFKQPIKDAPRECPMCAAALQGKIDKDGITDYRSSRSFHDNRFPTIDRAEPRTVPESRCNKASPRFSVRPATKSLRNGEMIITLARKHDHIVNAHVGQVGHDRWCWALEIAN
jgi:hypothetical protein